MIHAAGLRSQPLPWDDRRGTAGMALFIVTEASLFVVLFFAYFYLGSRAYRWPPVSPEITLALAMLVVLLTSSGVLHWSERALQEGRVDRARTGMIFTIALGVMFLVLQSFEYRQLLERVRPTADAYGSIFFTITSFHGAHVALGLLMLAFVVLLPVLEPADRPPHRPLHNASLYWHFVDAVWVLIVAVLYLLPRVRS